jgi:hypothetical protein
MIISPARDGLLLDQLLMEKANLIKQSSTETNPQLANRYESFKASNGWLANLKSRENIKS